MVSKITETAAEGENGFLECVAMFGGTRHARGSRPQQPINVLYMSVFQSFIDSQYEAFRISYFLFESHVYLRQSITA